MFARLKGSTESALNSAKVPAEPKPERRDAFDNAALDELKKTPQSLTFPFPEATQMERDIIAKTAPFTMKSIERQWTLVKAVQYVDDKAIQGDIVECGVWRGGNIMLAKMARKNPNISRRYVLFDTFRGVSSLSSADIDFNGTSAAKSFIESQREDYNDNCYSPREDVERNLRSVGLTGDETVLCEGLVEDTLRHPSNIPDKISILRLDTDWYESTRAELEYLYPRL